MLPFCAATGILAALWVMLLFETVHRLGSAAPQVFEALRHHLLWAAAAMILLMFLLHLLMRGISRLSVPRWLMAWRQWEFWPAWLFYLPVAVNYARLSLRYGGATLPSCANPGMFLSGLIGESKFETLKELQETSPGFVARSFLLQEGVDRLTQVSEVIAAGHLHYPFVLKPDMGQRGNGFKVIRDEAEARKYLDRVPVSVVMQEYIPGPHEIGVFYCRRPDEEKGRIFAITEKIFPVLEGDGVQTIEELIGSDPRASIMAETYLRRFERDRTRVPGKGELLRLVEAGNHAQGCIFKEGMHLWSRELEERIDTISRRIDGFFIGRYDLRYGSSEELGKGRGFQILELNGAASEATSAYDADHSLREAYALLFKQWDLVFSIAAQNRRQGAPVATPFRILTEWRRYLRRSRCYPQAD